MTFFGLANPEGTLLDSTGTTQEGLSIYSLLSGTQFLIVVEGKPGPSGAAVGDSAYQTDLTTFPDLQIEASNQLGNGSRAVCDRSGQNAGGVPAITPVSFDPTQTNINIVNDFACRFLDGSGQPIGRPLDAACVLTNPVTQDYGYANPESKIEFCALITRFERFAAGDTVLTVRLRDVDGNVGAPARIVVHIGL